MRFNGLVGLVGLTAFSVSADVVIPSFERVSVLVCEGSDVTAAAKAQLDVAQERVATGEVAKWMPDLTVGVDVYAARGEPTSFFAIENGPVQDPPIPNVYEKGQAWLGKVDMKWGLYRDGRWLGEDGLPEYQNQSSYDVAMAQLSSAQQDAYKLVSQYYFNALTYSGQIELLEPVIDQRRKQLDNMNTTLEAGVTTTDDLVAARAGYYNLKQKLTDAYRQREMSIRYLSLLTGQDVTLIAFEGGKANKELRSVIEKEVEIGDINTLIGAQPDISMLRAQLELEHQKLATQRGKLKPSMNLYLKLRSGDNFESAVRKDYGEVGLSFEYPLGAVPANYGESRSLQKSITAVSTELKYLEKVKALQAEAIKNGIDSARSKIEVAEMELARREQIWQSEQERVGSGLNSLEALIQAEDDRINAHLNLLGAFNAAWMNYVDAVLFTNTACGSQG